jgi:hypothetical protein
VEEIALKRYRSAQIYFPNLEMSLGQFHSLA